MHGGSGKAGLSQMSTEGLAQANLQENARARRKPSRRETVAFVAVLALVLLVWALWSLLG